MRNDPRAKLMEAVGHDGKPRVKPVFVYDLLGEGQVFDCVRGSVLLVQAISVALFQGDRIVHTLSLADELSGAHAAREYHRRFGVFFEEVFGGVDPPSEHR